MDPFTYSTSFTLIEVVLFDTAKLQARPLNLFTLYSPQARPTTLVPLCTEPLSLSPLMHYNSIMGRLCYRTNLSNLSLSPIQWIHMMGSLSALRTGVQRAFFIETTSFTYMGRSLKRPFPRFQLHEIHEATMKLPKNKT